MTKAPIPQIPAYIPGIYHWLYFNPQLYKTLDNPILLNILTLGGHYLLTEELKKEISSTSAILQIGVTLGAQIEKTYSALDIKHGSYTIIDVLPQILKKCQKRHSDKRITYQLLNAAKTIKGEYDTIICYMLLHELPPLTRAHLLNNVIKALKPGGKVIFIDYHLPFSYNPLKYIIRAVNRLYQPFAETLWKKSIKDLTPNAERCTWSQQTYFGGMYQKVVATKK